MKILILITSTQLSCSQIDFKRRDIPLNIDNI